MVRYFVVHMKTRVSLKYLATDRRCFCTFHFGISQPVENLKFKGENAFLHLLKSFFISWIFLFVQQ